MRSKSCTKEEGDEPSRLYSISAFLSIPVIGIRDQRDLTKAGE
ncbi:MAG: hypothetical protein M2R46_03365 [Verrucomicrobia subdivision 3 bacterium]|nr:hypothetical protein [Limisphaerales bacterium]